MSPSIVDLVPALGVADVVDRDVVVLAPEERHARRTLAAARACCARPSGPGAGRPPSARRGSRSPLCGSGQRAMSPAAKMPGALVSRYSSTSTPRSIARPACSASASRGRTPMPTTTRSAVERATALQRDLARVDRGRRVLPRWNTTPCSSCRPRTKSPSSGPSTRSSGRFSGATTCTSMPRARSEAATSRPMKLAPMTTARRAVAAPRDDRPAVARACAGVHVRQVACPGSVSRTGSAPVASSSALVGDLACRRRASTLARRHVDAGDASRRSRKSMLCSA